MKILVFVDIHGNIKALKDVEEKSKEADLLICAGDISQFEQGIDILLKRLNDLGKKVLIIHGNHENPDNLEKYCKKFENVIFIHKKIYKKNNVIFIGFGGGGFSSVDRDFEEFGDKIISEINKKNLNVILVTHAPPYGTRLDFLNEYNGNKSLRWFVEKFQPEFVICGHFHENRGEFDYIGKTEVINPGPYGRIIEI